MKSCHYFTDGLRKLGVVGSRTKPLQIAVSLRQPRFKLVHFSYSILSPFTLFYLTFLGFLRLLDNTFFAFTLLTRSAFFSSSTPPSLSLPLLSLFLFAVLLMWHCNLYLGAKRTMKINFKTTKTFITKLFIHFFSLANPALVGCMLYICAGIWKWEHDCVCYFFILRGSYNEIICLKTYLHISTILNVIIFFSLLFAASTFFFLEKGQTNIEKNT